MLTKGIVGRSQGYKDNFLADVSFNEGFSGGIELAVRDGVPDFELVRIGRSFSSSAEYVIRPEKENYEFTYNPSIHYNVEFCVHQKKEINFGITWIISIDQIRKFYFENQDEIKSLGVDRNDFFIIKN
jgi:hypothetical protein